MAVKPVIKGFEYFLDRLLRGFRSVENREPNNLEMILIRQEAGQKARDANKVIEVNFDPQNRWKDAKPDESATGIMTGIENRMGTINKANDKLKKLLEEREIIYGKAPKTPPYQKSQADIEFEIMEKIKADNEKAIRAFESRNPNKKPEDKADGGRMGFAGGKIVLGKKILDLLKNNKKIQQAVDDIFPTGDYKYDAEMAADALVELNPKEFKNLLREDLSDEVSSEIYGAVLKPVMSNMAKMRQLKKASRPEKTLKSIKETGTINISDEGIADEFARFMKETDPEGHKKIEQTVELSNFNPKGRKKNASGGLTTMLGE